jgi:uncharacterized membrane protein
MIATKTIAQSALASLLAVSVVSLTGCSNATPIKCYGVSQKGGDQWIGMSKGECNKLAGGVAKPMSTQEQSQVTVYPYDDYVKCYGVAAANMNDCGTKTSACGGSFSVPKSTSAWIAIPKEICEQVGGIVAIPGKDANSGKG